MKSNYQIRFITFIFLAFLLSCSQDESFVENIEINNKYSVPQANQVKTFFQANENFTNLNLKSDDILNLDIRWSESKTLRYKPNVDLSILYTPIEFNKTSRVKSFVASVKKDNKIEAEIITVAYSSTHNNIKGLSGYVFRHQIEGELIGLYKYENGEKIGEKNLVYNSKNYQKNDFEDCSGFTIFEILDMIEEYGIDNVICVTVGGGSGNGDSSNDNNTDDDPADDNGNTDNWSDPSDNLGGGGGSGTNDQDSGSTDGDNSPGDDLDEDAWWEEETWTEDTVLFANVQDPVVTDINDYLKCFDLTKSAIITLYADQPNPNSADTWSMTITGPDVGHTFISISQNGITRVFGYYPLPNVINPASGNISSTALIRNNENHVYDVSASTAITSSQLSNIINNIVNYNATYNLNTNNCTDFGLAMANMANIGVSDTSGSWPFGGNGSNPGNLGQDMRALTNNTNGVTLNTNGGIAPSNSGTCN